MLIGVNAGNEPADYQAFNTFVDGKLAIGSVFFDQRSEALFRGSWNWQAQQGAIVQKSVAGLIPKYSLCFPGGALETCEAVAAGKYDDLYRDVVQAIQRYHPGTVKQIIIRLPWEFNLKRDYQNQSVEGVEKFFIAAWRRIALIVRMVSSRFLIEWCPNVGKNFADPNSFVNWGELYDIVSHDIYIPDQAWVNPGTLDYYLHGDRGCDWLIELAARKNKKYAWAEWAVESERHADYMVRMCDYIVEHASVFHHHAYWSRGDGPITGKLHDGSRPTLAGIYREKLLPLV